MAVQAAEPVYNSHLASAIAASEEFESDFHGAGSMASLNAYT